MNINEAIDKARSVIRRQHKALATEETYIFWLRRYIRAVQRMPPDLPSEKKLERFLTDLACKHDLSACSQNQAFNAVLFFYRDVLGRQLANVNALRAQRPMRERHAPSVADTKLLLETIQNEGGYPTNLIARMLYGCGLRVSEPLNLRIKDINLESSNLCIRGAKGGNDRVVALPGSLVPEIMQQIEFAREIWHRDRQNRLPLMLPHRLARKYPAMGHKSLETTMGYLHAEALSVPSPLDALQKTSPKDPGRVPHGSCGLTTSRVFPPK